jgi:hypothetical protein
MEKLGRIAYSLITPAVGLGLTLLGAFLLYPFLSSWSETATTVYSSSLVGFGGFFLSWLTSGITGRILEAKQEKEYQAARAARLRF